MEVQIPTYDECFNPTIKALQALGGSGTVQEIYDKVCELENYTDAQKAVLHGNGPQNKIHYRLTWARSHLKNYEAIKNIRRGRWALTAKGHGIQVVDLREVRAVSKRKYNH